MRTFDEHLQERLKQPEYAKAFLEAAILEYEEDKHIEAFMLALRHLAEAKGGIMWLSQKTNLNRQNLYKIFNGQTMPRFDTVDAILNALGFRMNAVALG